MAEPVSAADPQAPEDRRRRPVAGSARRRAVGVCAVILGCLLAAGCGSKSGSGRPGGAAKSATLVFAMSGDAASLDPAYASDGNSWTPDQALFETLVDSEPGSTDIGPGLATAWKPNAAGTRWTFTLRDGVKFHDGTVLDGAAVCFNFERWYHFKGVQQSSSVSAWWQNVFGGFARNESKTLPPSLYRSCTAADPKTAVIALTRPSASFLPAISMVPFAIASPTALRKYQADKVGGNTSTPSFTSAFATDHPTGTGPFVFDRWEHGDRIVLKRNDHYWGPKPKIGKLVLRIIPDATARLQELQSGGINGYTSVSPSSLGQLGGDSQFEVYSAKPFAIGYTTLNTAKPPLDDVRVRQALAYAIDDKSLIRAKLPEGTEQTTQVVPSSLPGYSESAPEYPYDPAKARQLLAEAGQPHPRIEFWYPTDVSRPYMPSPQDVFQVISADLEKAGFQVKAKAVPWAAYVGGVIAGDAQAALFGVIGSYPDASYFLNLVAQQQFRGDIRTHVQGELRAADQVTDAAKRAATYERISAEIAAKVPVVPYGNLPQFTVFTANVKNFKPSPLGDVNFNDLEIAD
jgi:peptide/nickel transport system substrate-binding protein